MKKYLVSLLLAVMASVSLISCGYPTGYEGREQKIIGFEYKFNSNTIKLSEDDGEICNAFYIYDSPGYRQYTDTDGLPILRADSLAEGDTLIIYGYKYWFTDSKDKSNTWHEDYFNNNYKKYEHYYMDSVVIVGPSKIFEYHLGLYDVFSLTEVNSLCP